MKRLVKYFALVWAGCILIACAPAEPSNIDANTPADVPTSTSVNDQLCGGMSGQECLGENEYCHYEVKDMCGAADATGICRTKPQMCTMDYNPVCGCDENTYPNECAANSQGVSAAYTGDCK